MKRFNHFLYGFVPGLILPVLFMWVYLNRFYPHDLSFIETLKELYPGILLGKLLLLSAIPNLVLVFVFYKSDSFKIATGVLIGGMPYFIASIFML
ncbi:hypothetical protein Palpr_3028 [Paludibacter propionicigenes WB4]|uniref:Uncharacterized protein n=1 Tax=Paludibacter propionicigenes (strain DSM 17365 / JCM 13257 / WB4) TaxID=694427 RepID=E4T8P7_PALPW|nr:hypothetical protein [Paludibacter propionicigenes]ADQ81156.1 hypothetical protein Palpr_3028 [Paludibacter propionicigenes WB4]